MRSLKFPDMFNSTSTKTWTANDHLEATKQNLIALLSCEKGEFEGDPYFGINLKRYTFDQNNYILRDILIDEIYTQVSLFIPQVKFQRKDIKITQDRRGRLYCKISGVDQIDYSLNTYELVLYDNNK